MRIRFTEQFESAYKGLTTDEKRLVYKAIKLMVEDPKYPSLRVKKMRTGSNIWEARASIKIRLTFEMTRDLILLRNVGEHDKVLKNP
jgi:mRNA-degrading endonuclease RelE of RelBE toxin-antitoxin system